jgi:hypothetical protein
VLATDETDTCGSHGPYTLEADLLALLEELTLFVELTLFDDVCDAACDDACDAACDDACDAACDDACDAACDDACDAACDDVCDAACDDVCDAACDDVCDAACDDVWLGFGLTAATKKCGLRETTSSTAIKATHTTRHFMVHF